MKRPLAAASLAALCAGCYVYPQPSGQTLFACSSNADCGSGLTCQAGFCQPPTASSGGSSTGSSSGGSASSTGSSGSSSSGSISGASSGGTSGSTGSSTTTQGSSSGSHSSTTTSSSSSGTAPAPTTLSVYAGQIGGAGTLTLGLGALTRLTNPGPLALDQTGGFFVLNGNLLLDADPDAGQLSSNLLSTNEPDGLAFDGTLLYACDDSSPYTTVGAIPNGASTETACVGMGTPDFAGTCIASDAGFFVQPAGLAHSGPSDGGLLYVADFGGDAIYVVDFNAQTATTLAGRAGSPGSTDGVGTQAQFNGPFGLALDGDGGLYVTDQANFTLRWIALDGGNVTTVAGSAGSPGPTDGVGSAARFSSPAGVAVGQGQVFVADTGNDTVRQFSPESAAVTTLAGLAGVLGSNDGSGSAARFNGPEGVIADAPGHLYVSDTDNDTVRAITVLGGVVATVLGLAPHAGEVDGPADGGAEVSSPIGLCSDGTKLYVTDAFTVRSIHLATAEVTTLAGSGNPGSSDGTGPAAEFNYPSGCAVDQAGNLYVADTSNDTIRKIAIDGGQVTTLAGLAGVAGDTDDSGMLARFNGPQGLAFDAPTGTVLVADQQNCLIRRLEPSTGQVMTIAGISLTCSDMDGTGDTASFNGPVALHDDGFGDLYVGEELGGIRELVLATAQVTTVNWNGQGVNALAPDGNGGLYLLTTAAGSSQAQLQDVSLPGGLANALIGAVYLGTGVVPGPLASANFNTPAGLGFVPGQGLFITDIGENAVLLAH